MPTRAPRKLLWRRASYTDRSSDVGRPIGGEVNVAVILQAVNDALNLCHGG
jgi:hypothetical protein